jgi:hypothetical protein
MNIDRRSFMQGAAFIAVTPAFAGLFPAAPTTSRAREMASLPEKGTQGDRIVFKIDGWDLDAKNPSDNVVLIRINHGEQPGDELGRQCLHRKTCRAGSFLFGGG